MLQSVIQDHRGSPEGEVKGPVSLLIKDPVDGRLYIKRSPPEFVTGWEQFITEANPSVIDGGDPTGVEDSTDAIMDGFERGGLVQLQSGIYKVSGGDIPFPHGVQLEGLGDVTIDMTTADPLEAFIQAEGSLTPLPAISANLLFGARSITFASAPVLAIGDIIVIQDQTDFSYSVYRSYYKKGEYLTVLSVSGNTITTTSATYDSYTVGANLKAWKMNPVTVGIRNIKFRFKTGVDIPGIKISHGKNCRLDWLDLQGSRHTQLYLDRCYGMALSKIYTRDFNPNVTGLNYGVIGGGCQRVSITNFDLSATRHGADFGGEDQDGSVVNREITFSAGIASSNGGDTGLKFHGISEHCSVIGVALPNGLTLGGDHFTVKGCPIIANDNNLTYAIADGENVGLNFTIEGNLIKATRNFAEGIVSLSMRSGFRNKSRLEFDNTVELGTFGHANYPASRTYGVQVAVVDSPLTDDVSLQFDGHISTEVTTPGEFYGIYVNPKATHGIRQVILKDGLTLDRCGIKIRTNVGSVIGKPVITDALDRGIWLEICLAPSIATQWYQFDTAHIVRANKTGLYGILQSGANVQVRNGTIFDCARTPVGNSTDASIYLGGGNLIQIEDGLLGDSSATPSQSQLFTVDGCVTLLNRNNQNVGRAVNSLEALLSTITNDLTGVLNLVNDANPLSWNRPLNTVGIGAAASLSSLIPLLVRRDQNGAVVLEIQNQIALGNTAALAGFFARDKDSSGMFAAWRSDFVDSRLRLRAGVVANSNATNGIILDAPVAGQKIDIYAGSSGTKTAEFNADTTAGNLRQKVFDVDSGLLQSFKAGANGTGPGGVGRALYIANV